MALKCMMTKAPIAVGDGFVCLSCVVNTIRIQKENRDRRDREEHENHMNKNHKIKYEEKDGRRREMDG